MPAEIAGQRPLLERAAAGDREAFALVYDDQVEGVYRYLLAWTGDRAEAAELTGQVFGNALAWLPAPWGPVRVAIGSSATDDRSRSASSLPVSVPVSGRSSANSSPP